MTARGAWYLIAACTLLVGAGCAGRGLGRQYEYEEEVYLKVNGSATVVVNASLPALAALRGMPLDPSPTARVDREKVRDLFASPVARVTRVSRPWRRAGRRFVQVRIETDDIRTLSGASAFAWSTYRLDASGPLLTYTQRMGAAAGVRLPGVNWDGTEIIAVRLHLPSRIEYHNAPSRSVERGNILSWEQPLGDRLAGRPVEIEVRMQGQSILIRTLTVFGIAVTAALLLLVSIVWWVKRKGSRLEARA
jgi:hypothetical protein